MTAAERRTDSRTNFPPSSRPAIAHSGKVFNVLDMSKTGLSFAASSKSPFAVGDRFSGMLILHGGVRKPIMGCVVRVNRKCVALRLLRPLELVTP